jgi:hypothetical protein
MNKLAAICLTVVHRAKQAWFLPRTITLDLKQRRSKKTMLNEKNVERLDRLRNPSKYQGR